MPKSFEEVPQAVKEIHTKQKQTQHKADKKLEELSQSIRDINYDAMLGSMHTSSTQDYRPTPKKPVCPLQLRAFLKIP